MRPTLPKKEKKKAATHKPAAARRPTSEKSARRRPSSADLGEVRTAPSLERPIHAGPETMARLLALLLAPAAGLVAPARPAASAVKVQGVSDMIGGTIETAGLWDPLRLSDGASDEQLHRWRCVELKHGRVAMAAVFGLIVEPYIHPLAKSCHLAHPTDPILSGVELNFAGKAQILGFCAGVEALNYFIKKGDKYKPGDLLGAAYYVADEEDELWVSYQEKELNNGRLAMVAFAGFITQYGLYGNVDDMLFKPMLKPASELTCYGWLCV